MKITLSIALALFLFGCSDDSASSKKDEILKQVNKTTQEVKEKTKEVVEDVKENTQDIVEETTEKVEEKTQEVVKKAEKKVEEIKKEVPKTVAVAKSVDGEKLFKSSCMSCHGAKAEKKALTKSQVIAGWDSAKLQDALEGYKNKTYGASMKTIMEGKTKNLSDADIKALADYISTL